MTAHSHCNHCGAAYAELVWPRKCQACTKMTWINPIPVSVAVARVEGGGVFGVVRTIAPNGIALPGGFVDNGESWQNGCARELDEETGVITEASDYTLFDTVSTPDGTRILIFGLLNRELTLDEVASSRGSNETSGAILVTADNVKEIVFSIHEEVAARLLALNSIGGVPLAPMTPPPAL